MAAGLPARGERDGVFDTFQMSTAHLQQIREDTVADAPASIREVAAHAGVSVGTVSNVLNRPDIVAEPTRSRVRDAIKQLGFIRNESARQLRAGRSRTIGLVVLDVANPFFTDVARGVEDEASESGLAVILCNSDDQQVKETHYLELLEEQLIPEIAQNGLAEFCDVFCERSAFSLSESRGVLEAGKAHGLAPRVHAEQLSNTGATRMGIELGAASCDHLEYLKPADVRAIAKSKTVATLLPGCDFHLGLERYAPARELMDAGAIVGLATDFNPGTSPTLSMPMILALACTQLRMTPAEAIAAATINAAYSLGREKRIGSIETGKQADMAVFEVADYREIPYYFGVNHCWMTMKRGEMVYLRD